MNADLHPGAISGYVGDDCRWTYSVWNGVEWVDVGTDRAAAVQLAARLPEPRQPVD